MTKIEIKKEKLTTAAKAKKIEGNILRDEESFDFRSFIAAGYEPLINQNARILSAHLNKQRARSSFNQYNPCIWFTYFRSSLTRFR
jgi:hypothetical protein